MEVMQTQLCTIVLISLKTAASLTNNSWIYATAFPFKSKANSGLTESGQANGDDSREGGQERRDNSNTDDDDINIGQDPVEEAHDQPSGGASGGSGDGNDEDEDRSRGRNINVEEDDDRDDGDDDDNDVDSARDEDFQQLAQQVAALQVDSACLRSENEKLKSRNSVLQRLRRGIKLSAPLKQLDGHRKKRTRVIIFDPYDNSCHNICNVCQKRQHTSEYHFLHHVANHKGKEKQFKCRKCGMRFLSPDEMFDHDNNCNQ